MQNMALNQDIAEIDLSKIAALQQKRTLAFINHFLITTVQFLNNFVNTCEQKLMHFERKLEMINASMVLLEARLSSIPELNKFQEVVPKLLSNSTETSKEKIDETTIELHKSTTVAENEINETTNEDCLVRKREYERFVKMVQVGVPMEAVKLKISLEGLDPNELDKILGK